MIKRLGPVPFEARVGTHVICVVCLSGRSYLAQSERGQLSHTLFCCYVVYYVCLSGRSYLANSTSSNTRYCVVYSACVSGGSCLANGDMFNTRCFVVMLFTPLV